MGLHHVTKAMASLAVLRDAMIMAQSPRSEHLYVDDRPPRPPAGWVKRINEQASALLEHMRKALADKGGIKKPYTQLELEAKPAVEPMPVAKWVVRYTQYSDEDNYLAGNVFRSLARATRHASKEDAQAALQERANLTRNPLHHYTLEQLP